MLPPRLPRPHSPLLRHLRRQGQKGRGPQRAQAQVCAFLQSALHVCLVIVETPCRCAHAGTVFSHVCRWVPCGEGASRHKSILLLLAASPGKSSGPSCCCLLQALEGAQVHPAVACCKLWKELRFILLLLAASPGRSSGSSCCCLLQALEGAQVCPAGPQHVLAPLSKVPHGMHLLMGLHGMHLLMGLHVPPKLPHCMHPFLSLHV